GWMYRDSGGAIGYALEQLICNTIYWVGLAHGIKVKRRNTVFDEFTRLLDAPLDPYFLRLGVVLALVDGIGQVFGYVDMKYLGQYSGLRLAGNRLDSRNDGLIDPDLAAPRDKIKILLVVEEHLGHDILSSKIDLKLQIL